MILSAAAAPETGHDNGFSDPEDQFAVGNTQVEAIDVKGKKPTMKRKSDYLITLTIMCNQTPPPLTLLGIIQPLRSTCSKGQHLPDGSY
jgi:hypothetical protein